jgi:hypothetical protein
MDKNHILVKLSESKKTDFGKRAFVEQSISQRVFSVVWAVESEVNNGGFSQYFHNESREAVVFVAEALDLIGAPRTASICRRAIAHAFPVGLPSTPEATSAAADWFCEDTHAKLQALDQEFMAYPHNLTDLLFAYVSKHSETFGDLPIPDDV